MTLPREPVSALLPPPMVFYRVGPVARGVVALLSVAAAMFIAVMSVWMTQDSWLMCTRHVDGTGSCVVRYAYPLGIASEKQLPQIRFARTETQVNRDRYGEHPHEVLRLESLDGASTEFPGVGKNGARAATVANEVNRFLSGDASSVPPWHLRESAPVVLVVLMLAMAAGMLVLARTGFSRVRLSYEPHARTVILRVGRWPLRPTSWSASIDEIERVAMTTQIGRNGTAYGAEFQLSSAAPPAPLGITSLRQTPVKNLMMAVQAQVETWRKL